MRLPRVTILYNEPTLPPDHPDADSEHDVLDTVDVVSKILLDAGLPFARLGVGTDPAAIIDGLKAQAPDVVFNVYEGTAAWGESETYVAGLLELLKIPFTGSSVQPILVAKSKTLTKQLLQTAGLPTAKFFMLDALPVPPCPLPWPVIVKPALQDASVGIDQNAVVTTQAALEARVKHVLDTYGPPVLVEQFVRGREFHISVWNRDGTAVTLPFTEIVFLEQEGDDPIWPIVSFDAKWKPDSRDYKATPVKNPPDPIDPEVEKKLSDVCVRASELVGYRDYARVDVRLTAAGEPYILEVNPNPCINPLAGVAAALATANIPYPEFILGLVNSALRRGPRPELADGWETRKAVEPPAVVPALPAGWRVRPASAAEGPPALAWIDEALWKECEPVGTDFGVVLTNGSAVGGVAFASVENVRHGVYRLDFVAVDPALRRQGCGRAMLAELEKQIAAAGGRFVAASFTSAPATGGLRQFLLRCGYATCGEVPDYYRDQCSRLTFAKVLKAESPGTAVPGLSITPAP
jgi:D-alanine-D-alanine ligase